MKKVSALRAKIAEIGLKKTITKEDVEILEFMIGDTIGEMTNSFFATNGTVRAANKGILAEARDLINLYHELETKKLEDAKKEKEKKEKEKKEDKLIKEAVEKVKEEKPKKKTTKKVKK